MKKFLFTTAMIAISGSAIGQTTTQPSAAAMTAPGATAIAQDTTTAHSIPADAPLKWAPSAVLPKGAEGAVLIGDPTKTGDIVVVRTKFPANYEVPAHTHPFTETITVISGSVGFGMGEKIDKTALMAKPGAIFLNPANHAHTVWTGDEPAIIQVQYIGPGGIAFVNPADDPRKK
jgi:quercetin dioxygenase-like cupin family protein